MTPDPREQRKGTILCWLFGHKFIGKKFTPTKCEGSETGWITAKEWFPIDYCFKCGLDKKEIYG